MYTKILELREKNEYPNGLEDEIIDEVSKYCVEHFNCPLPDDYSQFLKEANGFIYDGCSVYSVYTQDIEDNHPIYRNYDFVTSNKMFRDYTDINEYLMLGSSNMDYLCYEIESKQYQILTNSTMDIISSNDKLLPILLEYFNIE